MGCCGSSNTNSNNYSSSRHTGSGSGARQVKAKSQKEINQEAKKLYIITAYYNPVNCQTRYKLYIDFRNRMSNVPNVVLVTIECAFGQDPFQVTSPGWEPLNIQVRSNSRIWVKENLINLALTKLPPHWQYIAWVDGDVEFTDPKWVDRTIWELKKSNFVQMFKVSKFLGPDNYTVLREDKSFMFYYMKGQPINRTQNLKNHRHPGYAWASRRDILNQLGGLFDKNIVGNGDKHMAFSVIGRGADSIPDGVVMSDGFMKALIYWQSRAQMIIGSKVNFVNMELKHYWHGDRVDRQYIERWYILMEFMYDPHTDLALNTYGVYNIAPMKAPMEQRIITYFQLRREDEKVVKDVSARNTMMPDYLQNNQHYLATRKPVKPPKAPKAPKPGRSHHHHDHDHDHDHHHHHGGETNIFLAGSLGGPPRPQRQESFSDGGGDNGDAGDVLDFNNNDNNFY